MPLFEPKPSLEQPLKRTVVRIVHAAHPSTKIWEESATKERPHEQHSCGVISSSYFRMWVNLRHSYRMEIKQANLLERRHFGKSWLIWSWHGSLRRLVCRTWCIPLLLLSVCYLWTYFMLLFLTLCLTATGKMDNHLVRWVGTIELLHTGWQNLYVMYTLTKFWRYNKVNLATSAFCRTLAQIKSNAKQLLS